MRGLMAQCLAYHEGSQSLSSGSCFCHPYHQSLGLTQLLSSSKPNIGPSPHLVTCQLRACCGRQEAPWAIMAHNTTPNHCTEMPHGNNQASMAIQLEQGKAAAWLRAASHTRRLQRALGLQAPAGSEALLGCMHLPFP